MINEDNIDEKKVKMLQENFKSISYMLNSFVDTYVVQEKQNLAQKEYNFLHSIINKMDALTRAVNNINERLLEHENRQEKLIKKMAGIDE